jgi:hypothetical protein
MDQGGSLERVVLSLPEEQVASDLLQIRVELGGRLWGQAFGLKLHAKSYLNSAVQRCRLKLEVLKILLGYF